MVESGELLLLNKANFETILAADHHELKIAHSLTENHLDVQFNKTNVRIAAQLLSTKTAAAMRYLNPEKETQAAVVKTFNDVSNI